MDLFSKCKELYEKIRYFEYGIPVDGAIKPVPSPEYFAKNYHFLKPEEFEKYGGGICWDYVEYERKCLEVNDIDFNQYYLITNTPPNYDTHTFITVKDGDDLIYIESSFKRVEHIIDGVQKFKTLEDIVRLITTNMWECNGNDKRFDEFKYDVCKFKGHPQYGCTCQEYMDWMDDNSDIVIQDVSINPKKVNEDELPVEEFSVNKIDTKFTQFVCESHDPEEYDEVLHDHLEDEDDIYNESWVDFKNGVHPSSGLMFHVSLKNDMDGKTITPQLPSYITDGGKLDDNYQEDTKTKRLCVSPSIEGCMIAILNYKKIREHVGDKFYVYTPEKPFSQYKHKTNKEIVKDKLVFDANITKEAWILEPCKLKLYGIIKLKKVKDLKKKPTVEKNIKMNTIKLDYEWIMTPKASGKFNKAIGDSPDKEDTKEKPIKEYAVPGSFYDDIKPHPGGVYALVEDDSYRSHFCHIDFQGHDNKYLGWNAPTGSELILKTQEVIKSEKWEFRKSETDTIIPEYTHIFTYAQQILPIIRLDKIKDRLRDLLAPYCPLTVHDPNSDTDIEYVCIQPQQYEVIDKKQTSYVYDTAYKHMFENHIVYLPIVDNLGMFEVKHTTHVAGTYDDNLFFEELFYGPTISYKLFDAFKDLNSVTLYDISDINAWDFACDYEDHYDEDGERIEPGDPKHPSNKRVNESANVLISNEEFFMEASKNPDIKARKRTVKNLRKLGVDRAHEVDNKREIDELRRRMDDLHKKYDNKEISFGEALDQELLLKEKIRSLERGVDINIKDSYGNKHKVKLTSDKDIPDAYNAINNTINIDPNTMNSNKFDSSFNHEAGHAEQNKRFGLYDLDTQNYNLSNTDDYPIKCAKLFLQKNKDKMNSHDAQWTELHADFLSCKKSGFGKMIKDVYSFKKSKKQVEDAMDACIKYNEAFCKKLDDRYLKLKDEDGNERTLTQKDIDECVSSYNQAKEKLDQYHTTLSGRYNELLNKMFDGRLSNAYKAKLEKLLNKLEHRRIEISDKMLTLEDDFKHNGIPAKNALNYDFAMKKQIREYNDNLKDLKAAFTTYDYRIKFMEDMYWIHNGHPGRCSMKYPPMTPADKKYMQEADCILVSNDEFFMESQTTRNKVLERLKYDPTTQTIDTGVKDAQTGNNIRIKLKISSTKIDPELNKNGGAQITKIVYDRPSSLYEMLSDSRCCIKVESKLLNQRNNSALAIIYHEIGHLVDWIATKYGNHLSNEDKQTCYRILNFLNKKADYFDRSDTNAHLNRRETFADKFANTKISSQALNKSNEKTDRKIMNDAYSEYKKFKKNKEYTKARENSLRHDKHELGSQLRSQLISSKMESSNILVSNDEFFGLSMIQESHKNITKHSFKSLTKKGITVDRNSETGKLVKKVIDNVLKNHSLPSVKLNPSGFGVAKETDTFFYGYPRYIDGEIPTDSKGKQLRFMAQINCKELKSLPDYPHTGLLQFWVHGDSEILDGPVKAIYIEKPNKNNIANVSLDEDLYSYKDPGDFPYIDIKGYNHSDNLLFKSTTEEMIGPNITDLDVLYDIFSEEYKKLTGKKADISALVDYIWDDDRLQPSWGNRVGGYPSSTQETSSKRTKSWNTMLLQLESIDRKVYWGDFGIAAFYISHNDLIRKDFSKVGFDWDCY